MIANEFREKVESSWTLIASPDLKRLQFQRECLSIWELEMNVNWFRSASIFSLEKDLWRSTMIITFRTFPTPLPWKCALASGHLNFSSSFVILNGQIQISSRADKIMTLSRERWKPKGKQQTLNDAPRWDMIQNDILHHFRSPKSFLNLNFITLINQLLPYLMLMLLLPWLWRLLFT